MYVKLYAFFLQYMPVGASYIITCFSLFYYFYCCLLRMFRCFAGTWRLSVSLPLGRVGVGLKRQAECAALAPAIASVGRFALYYVAFAAYGAGAAYD